MSNHIVKVALAQFNSTLGDKTQNLQRMTDFCHQAAEQGAKLICFPELATTGYRGDLLSTRLWDLAIVQAVKPINYSVHWLPVWISLL